MEKVSTLTQVVEAKLKLIRSLQREIRICKNDILVCTSAWEKVDIHVWNSIREQWEMLHCFRFAATTGKNRSMEFSSLNDYHNSPFYNKYIKDAIAGVDYVDVISS